MKMAAPQVRVQLFRSVGADTREVSQTPLTALMQERRSEIEAAIQETSEIIGASLDAQDAGKGWRISELTATFGLTLTAEAGVIVSKASAGASMEVTLTVTRSA